MRTHVGVCCARVGGPEDDRDTKAVAPRVAGERLGESKGSRVIESGGMSSTGFLRLRAQSERLARAAWMRRYGQQMRNAKRNSTHHM